MLVVLLVHQVRKIEIVDDQSLTFISLGATGAPGQPGPGLQRTGFMVVRHSQSAQVPDCPSGMVKLWDGYSLLMMQGNDHGYHQDLGSAGSCLQKFSALPYLRCDHTNVCYYGQTNDLTYYLSTTEPMPMMPVQRESNSTLYLTLCCLRSTSECDVIP